MDDFNVTPAKTGESCPCCGQPIKTKDPALLWLLGWIRMAERLPNGKEIDGILEAVRCRGEQKATK